MAQTTPQRPSLPSWGGSQSYRRWRRYRPRRACLCCCRLSYLGWTHPLGKTVDGGPQLSHRGGRIPSELDLMSLYCFTNHRQTRVGPPSLPCWRIISFIWASVKGLSGPAIIWNRMLSRAGGQMDGITGPPDTRRMHQTWVLFQI